MRFSAVVVFSLLSALGCGEPPAPAAAAPAVRKTKAPPPQPAPPKPAPEPPRPLAQAPATVRGVYLTSWSAGLKKRVEYVCELAKRTGVNAVVIDVKDYSGYLAYRMALPEAQKYGAIRVAIRDIDWVVNRFHQDNLYTIARITVFQDPILAAARPELAVHRKSLLKGEPPATKATLWLDRKGLAWIDPAARPAWEYIVRVARDARSHGFDELNFDYIRFPSDGNLKDMVFPLWDGKTPKPAVIRSFFRYLRRELPDVTISADLFGLATVNSDDLGIGQVIEDAYANFDAVCPMVYPSHFARGFRGYPNPAEHPYDVIKYSMTKAVERLRELRSPKAADGAADGAPARVAKLRPWIQDFHLGARYDAEKVRAEIRAAQEALGDDYAGYLVWAPSNIYTAAGLTEEGGAKGGP